MKLLDRYVTREYLLILAYCLLGFVFLTVIADLFDKFTRLIQAEVGWLLILRYYGSFLAGNLETILPASLLLATLYTLWTFARHGELTAMRASGVCLYRVMVPFAAVGLVASVTAGVVKETVGPQAAAWAKELARNKFQWTAEHVYLRVHHYQARDRRLWQVGALRPGHPVRLEEVIVTQERPDGSTVARWTAQRAEWLDGEWWFFDVRRQDYTETGNPIGSPKPVPGSEAGVTLPGLREKPMDFLSEVLPWDQLSVRAMRRYLRNHPDLSRAVRAQRLTDLHQRLATPWACLVVTLFGVPVAARTARQGVLVGIFVTLACFFAFYGIGQAGVFLAKRQTIPPWLGGWLSHVTFLATGGALLPRLR